MRPDDPSFLPSRCVRDTASSSGPDLIDPSCLITVYFPLLLPVCDDYNGIPAVPLAKEAVSTCPANGWGPDETLHAWEIVMFKDLTPLETLAPLSQPSGHEILLPIHFAIPQQAASTCLMLVSASKQLPYELAQSAACSRSYLILPSVRPTSAASKAPLRAKDANCGITTPPLASPSRRLTTSALLKGKKIQFALLVQQHGRSGLTPLCCGKKDFSSTLVLDQLIYTQHVVIKARISVSAVKSRARDWCVGHMVLLESSMCYFILNDNPLICRIKFANAISTYNTYIRINI